MPKTTCAVTVCDRNTFALGYCTPHYKRFKRTGSAGNTTVNVSPQERFWTKVTKTETCWLWTDAPKDTGYGTFHLSAAEPVAYAHRVAYRWLVGPIPAGMQLDHLCRVRLCVNPAHLEPVSPYVNQMRGINPAAQNKRKTHCLEGHEFTPENTYLRPDNGNRQCRTCNYERARIRRLARRAVAA